MHNRNASFFGETLGLVLTFFQDIGEWWPAQRNKPSQMQQSIWLLCDADLGGVDVISIFKE